MQFNLVHADSPIAVTQEEYEAGKAFAAAVLGAVDERVLPKDVFVDDVQGVVGSQPPVKGREAVEKFLQWEFSAISDCNHSIEYLIVLRECIIAHSEVSYTFTNGEQKKIKAVTIFGKCVNEAKASRLQLIGDFTEVIKTIVGISGLPPH